MKVPKKRLLIIETVSVSFKDFKARLSTSAAAVRAGGGRYDAVLCMPKAHADSIGGAASVFSKILMYEDFDSNHTLELDVVAEHKRSPFSRIVTFRERMVMRAAYLRSYLGIPGQKVAGAQVFRDKYLMKQVSVSRHIPTPKFAAINSMVDLIGFAGKMGYPFIIKPRTDAGMHGFHVLRSPRDLRRIAAELCRGSRFDQFPAMIAEEYCGHKMAHVDGIWGRNGLVSVCSSLYKGLGPQHRLPAGKLPMSGSIMLAPGSPLAIRLEEFTGKLMRALPAPDLTTFHAELWITASGKILLNEVASRSGGMFIHPMLHAAFGRHLETDLVRLCAGEKVKAGKFPPRLAANFRVPVRSGRVKRIPQSCPLEWVHLYLPSYKKGAVVPPARYWYSNMATFVISAPDATLLRVRTKQALDWFWSETKMETM